MNDLIAVNENVLKFFASALAENRLGHAYLFSGPVSAGKTQTALAVAKLISCESSGKKPKELFCGQCPSCLRIDKGSHPDVHLLARLPDETTVKIDQIRQMIYEAQLKPFESPRKIFIIKNIEDLTPEASNSLLKTLEEPTPSSLLILTTAFLDKILDTVKSRCHMIPFFTQGNGALEACLVKNYKIDRIAAHFLAYFSEGCLGKALRFNQNDIFRRKNQIIDNFILPGDSEPYFKELSADKEKTKEALDIIYSWFRDLLLFKSGIEELKLIHTDRAKDLKGLEGKYSFEELSESLAEISKTNRLLQDNMNLKIALTLMKEKLWRR